jgi:hypothetical protein
VNVSERVVCEDTVRPLTSQVFDKFKTIIGHEVISTEIQASFDATEPVLDLLDIFPECVAFHRLSYIR